MTKNDFRKIQEHLQKLFMNEDIKSTTDTVPTDVKGWISFEHINLRINLEEEFDIKFNVSDVIKI